VDAYPSDSPVAAGYARTLMGRAAIPWIAVVVLAATCLAPWTEVTTFQDETVFFGVANQYSNGGIYLLGLVGCAAYGLLVRAVWLSKTCAAVAALLIGVIMYESPER
jgi:hypothetical protein